MLQRYHHVCAPKLTVADTLHVLRSCANLIPSQTLYLHRSGRQSRDTALQRGRPVRLRLHVPVFTDIAQLNPLFRDQITNFSTNQVASNVFDEPDKLADFTAAVSSGEVGELQDVFESLVVDDRLCKALLVLLIDAQLQSKLS